jgi:hypothetical protein
MPTNRGLRLRLPVRIPVAPQAVARQGYPTRDGSPDPTSKTPAASSRTFDVSAIPEDAVREISDGIKSRVRFNAVVKTGVPGFIPRQN